MTTEKLTSLPDADFSRIGADFMSEEEEFMKGVPGYAEGNIYLPSTPDDLGPGGGNRRRGNRRRGRWDPVLGRRVYD